MLHRKKVDFICIKLHVSIMYKFWWRKYDCLILHWFEELGSKKSPTWLNASTDKSKLVRWNDELHTAGWRLEAMFIGFSAILIPIVGGKNKDTLWHCVSAVTKEWRNTINYFVGQSTVCTNPFIKPRLKRKKRKKANRFYKIISVQNYFNALLRLILCSYLLTLHMKGFKVKYEVKKKWKTIQIFT